MRWPLRRQIMLPLVLVAACSLGAVGAINAQFSARQTRQRIEVQLAGVAKVLATSNFPLTDNVLQQMQELSGAEFVVTDAIGAVRASSLAERPRSFPSVDGAAAGAEAGPLGAEVSIGGVTYFDRVTEISPRGAGEEPRRLHVLFPESQYRSAWGAAFVPPIVVGTLTIVAVAAVASVVARRLSGAAARLSDEMLRIARGDFSQIQLPKTDDEIRDLSLAVNRTAEMLAEYEQQVRRTEQVQTVALLGAGLAHEMRNAATGCRVALDLHAEQCTSDGESISVAKRQLRLMENQLQRFLRAGKSTAATIEREFEFSNLVQDLLPLVRPVARHAGVDLRWRQSAAETLIAGDDEALGQAVMNLLLNAIEAVQHSSGGGTRFVDAELRSRPGFAELVVSDNGPGPAAAVAEELFAPFTTSKPEGVGLGLAVVKQIVEAHQGAVDWMRDGGVTQFRIEIPLAKKGERCV